MKASILALRFLAMRELKEMFSVRLVPLAKSLIKAEAAASECSEAEVIERWAIAHARSPGARALLIEHGEKDHTVKAVVSALREDAKDDHESARTKPGKPNTRPYKLSRAKPLRKTA